MASTSNWFAIQGHFNQVQSLMLFQSLFEIGRYGHRSLWAYEKIGDLEKLLLVSYNAKEIKSRM
jgi:hypothetical protein